MKPVYISEMDGNDSARSSKAIEFLRLLNERYELVRTPDNEFDGYDNVYKRIAGTGAIIVMYDEYWTSSTWRCSELTFADGGVAMSSNVPTRKMPAFIYRANPDYPLFDWIEKRFIVLPDDPKSAVENILKHDTNFKVPKENFFIHNIGCIITFIALLIYFLYMIFNSATYLMRYGTSRVIFDVDAIKKSISCKAQSNKQLTEKDFS